MRFKKPEKQEFLKYLMKQVTDKWIDITIRPFVSIMLILKRKLAKGYLPRKTILAQKAEPAMRKILKECKALHTKEEIKTSLKQTNWSLFCV